MPELKESVQLSFDKTGDEECIFCHEQHKAKKEEPLPNHTYVRQDSALTAQGRTYIKGDSERAKYYPRDENGGFVSPLEPAQWPDGHIFKTYKTEKGKVRKHGEKYQEPPIMGWIAAPHHMVAICCMNGENGLPAVPKVNPWAKQGNYEINHGSNCIFLPSSASQFYVAYYYWKVRKTGRPLQGHLGAHRKSYFQNVWDKLEKMVRDLSKLWACFDTEDEDKKKSLVEEVLEKLGDLEKLLFHKIAAMKPAEEFRLGAESYIEIPDESDPLHVPSGVVESLQPYETLPKWY